MMDRSMADEELEQIEIEAEGYELENYPISGVQLMAIIQRLRMAEEATRAALPFRHFHIQRARDARANNAWAMPRLCVMLLSLCAGVGGAVLTGTIAKLDTFLRVGAETWEGWQVAGFVGLSFLLPMLTTMLPLMAWIDRVAKRRYDAGVYDAED